MDLTTADLGGPLKEGSDVTIINPSIFNLLERFPEHREAIRDLFEHSQAFKSLCMDHQKCLEAIRYWKQSPRDDAPLRSQEYETLFRELEEEIVDILNQYR